MQLGGETLKTNLMRGNRASWLLELTFSRLSARRTTTIALAVSFLDKNVETWPNRF